MNALSEEFGSLPKNDGKKEGKPALHKKPSRRERAKLKAAPSVSSGGAGREHRFDNMRSSLATRVSDRADVGGGGRGGGGDGTKAETAFGRKTLSKKTRSQARSKHEDVMKERAEASVVQTSGLVAPEKQKEQVVQGVHGKPDRNVETSPSGRERRQFEELMASMDVPVPEAERESSTAREGLQAHNGNLEVADDVNVPVGLVSSEQSTSTLMPIDERPRRIERPSFSHSPASDAVNVPAGLVAGRPKTKSPLAFNSTDENSEFAQPEETKLPATPSRSETSNQRTYSFGSPRKPVSLAAKVQEAKNRPKWGGFTTSEPLTSGKASFNSLRAADKVSPEPVVSTAGETKAWGLDLAIAKSVSEPVSLTKSIDDEMVQDEKPRSTIQYISDALSSVKSASFDVLRQTLHGRVDSVKDKDRDKTTAHNDQDASVTPEGQQQQGSENADVQAAGESPSQPEPQRNDNTGRIRRHGSVRTVLKRGDNTHRYIRGLSFRKTQSDTPFFIAPQGESTAGTDNDGIENAPSAVPYDNAMETLAKLHMDQDVSPDRIKDAATHGPPADSGGEHQDVVRKISVRDIRLPSRRSSGFLGKAEQATGPSETASGEPAQGAEEHRSMSEVMSSSAAAPPSETTATAHPEPSPPLPPMQSSEIKSVCTSDLEVTALNIPQPRVPPVQYGLDRVLFNPGVYQLQDTHSRVYNFDPYLQKIMPVADFDFNALKEYKTSSQDAALSTLAKEYGKKFVGSTSSMTGTLGHFHYLLSNWRDLNLNMLSRTFTEEKATFTNINKAPNAIFLRWQNGTYAIDADKEYDSPNVLMMLGKSMEKLLTLPRDEYERYRKGSSNAITDTEQQEPESYEYTTMGDFLMRSQLDAHDERLPGTGMFDLKTRSVLSVRMDAEGYESMSGYEIHTLQGGYESYEREYYDMLRSTMLKYMLQARMGRMDGIFVAYHNVKRIFGFQYIPIAEMDRAIHGQVHPCLGDQEFRTSLKLMNDVMEMATRQFPERSLRMHYEAKEKPQNMMWVFAEPMEEEEIEGIQATSKEKIAEYERVVMGVEKKEKEAAVEAPAEAPAEVSAEAPVSVSEPSDDGTSYSSSLSDDTVSTSPSTPGSDYTSTLTPADPTFYDGITPDPSANLKPLFAATIICMNYVNGVPTNENRPKDLKRGDKWEVQYILKEAQMSLAEKWARYDDTKTRRRMNYEKFKTEEGDEAIGGEKRKENYFIQTLREMSAKGAEFRAKIDEMEKGREKVVFGVPVKKADDAEAAVGGVAAESANEEQRWEVENVEEYMGWLYGHQDSKK